MRGPFGRALRLAMAYGVVGAVAVLALAALPVLALAHLALAAGQRLRGQRVVAESIPRHRSAGLAFTARECAAELRAAHE